MAETDGGAEDDVPAAAAVNDGMEWDFLRCASLVFVSIWFSRGTTDILCALVTRRVGIAMCFGWCIVMVLI